MDTLKYLVGGSLMSRQYDSDWIDGRRVSQLAVCEDYILTGTHAGTVHVECGQFTLAGVLQGTLDVQREATVLITGKQQGSVSLESGSVVTVYGAIEGSATVGRGATLIIEPGGKLAGSLTNDGEVVLRGVFGGAKAGSGKLRTEGQGYIKQPTIRNGISYYEW